MQKKTFLFLVCMGLLSICILSGIFIFLFEVGALPSRQQPLSTPAESSDVTLPEPSERTSLPASESEAGEGRLPFPVFAALLFAFGIILVVCFAYLLSKHLTAQLVKPIAAMAGHLEEIEQAIPFEELRPFALSIHEQQKKRDQTEKIRQEFTANVSHELKTPLTSISGYAEMLENGMVQEEDIAEFAGKIHNEAGRLITLIGDIIQLAELDDPNFNLEFQPVNLMKIACHTADLLSLQAERANVTLSVAGDNHLVQGNQKMLEELVYNLCDNAIRYNRKQGSVILSVQLEQDRVCFSVADTGIGISKEHQDRVFERFYRVDKSRSKETGGTGLGLAIVKHIALQHHAKITVFSEENQGTQIHVLFPPCPLNPEPPRHS